MLFDKEKLLKVYANLPLNLRGEIILVLPEKGPITWNVAYVEVENETLLGVEILKKLIELNII
ncbi:TPA: hypothetical protein DDZ10_03380 [Candidatus Uhrbacteria bacterium]|nr:MAG: hypothetical protein A3D69_01210 [Candidatus Uhrbacteria bacterium RIFCSPHIGHO2_02_FULL_54_11]HBL39685.1 hypothetical protein [Candidatus Uhrbacteria bacterium]